MTIVEAHEILTRSNIEFEAGLTADEFARIERRFAFEFPPDFREFLSLGVPRSAGWVDWRGDDQKLIERFSWPVDSICFDIKNDAFWLPEWGLKPEKLEDAFAVARREVAAAPVLLPIFSHRYIPSSPAKAGNPVFSVYQTDIIYYGADLLDYFANEFQTAFCRDEGRLSHVPRQIALWSQLEELNR